MTFHFPPDDLAVTARSESAFTIRNRPDRDIMGFLGHPNGENEVRVLYQDDFVLQYADRLAGAQAVIDAVPPLIRHYEKLVSIYERYARQRRVETTFASQPDPAIAATFGEIRAAKVAKWVSKGFLVVGTAMLGRYIFISGVDGFHESLLSAGLASSFCFGAGLAMKEFAQWMTPRGRRIYARTLLAIGAPLFLTSLACAAAQFAPLTGGISGDALRSTAKAASRIDPDLIGKILLYTHVLSDLLCAAAISVSSEMILKQGRRSGVEKAALAGHADEEVEKGGSAIRAHQLDLQTALGIKKAYEAGFRNAGRQGVAHYRTLKVTEEMVIAIGRGVALRLADRGAP